MLEISAGEGGEIRLSGRFDASQEATATAFFDGLTEARVIDMSQLSYISSLGLGILLGTQKRLVGATGQGLKLVNLNPHLMDIFRYSGLCQIFQIDT